MDSVILIVLFIGIAALLMAIFILQRQLREKRLYPALSEGVEIEGIPSEASSTPTYDLDIETGRLQWNDAFYNTFGYKLSDPVGSLEWWTSHIHPEDALALNTTMDKLLDADSAGWTARYRFRMAGGTYVTVRDQAYIRRNDEGKAVHLTGSLTVIKNK
ncbi:MAG TPA: PAS domain-containing protein [Candidatus Saccharimonadales bacterium]|nr:PAS domain-containing protein [Candidatus Saccharimonadales bacterium]